MCSAHISQHSIDRVEMPSMLLFCSPCKLTSVAHFLLLASISLLIKCWPFLALLCFHGCCSWATFYRAAFTQLLLFLSLNPSTPRFSFFQQGEIYLNADNPQHSSFKNQRLLTFRGLSYQDLCAKSEAVFEFSPASAVRCRTDWHRLIRHY